MSSRRRHAALLVLVAGLVRGSAAAGAAEPLPVIGQAADFRLDTLDGAQLSLGELRGKVVVVTFVEASCRDVCLTETAKLAMIARRLGADFDRRVRVVMITLAPEADSVPILRDFAARQGADLAGWTMLTGAPTTIRRVAGDYGVVFGQTAAGAIEHNTVTSIVDRDGRLRVQYLGAAFDPLEMLDDIRSLLAAGGGR